jgi:hypothetical protein
MGICFLTIASYELQIDSNYVVNADNISAKNKIALWHIRLGHHHLGT